MVSAALVAAMKTYRKKPSLIVFILDGTGNSFNYGMIKAYCEKDSIMTQVG